MTTHTPENSLEQKLQPWIDQGEYIIGLTIIIMCWAAGWVDLIAFESFNGTILGRYSVPLFMLILAYSSGFIIWFWLIISLNALDKFKQALARIQKNPLLGFLFFLSFAVLALSTIYVRYWVQLPLMQGAILVIFLTIACLILFTKPDPTAKFQVWRKVVITLILGFLAIELILHGLAYIGVLPLQNLKGLYEPYGLVYQNEEGHAYARTNQFGWYAPEFEINADNQNILLVGDSYIQGLQVSFDNHMAQQLTDLMPDDTTHVFPTGMSDYGAGTYLNRNLYTFIWESLEPDEIIVFFNVANDFQFVSEPYLERPYYIINDDGRVVPHPDDELYAHVFEHVVFDGHQPPSLLETLTTYSFIISSVQSAFGSPPHPNLLVAPNAPWREIVPFYDVDMPIETRTETQPFGTLSFMFADDQTDQANESYDIAFRQLDQFQNFMISNNITVRLVVLPFFPEAFYDIPSGSDWDTQLGDYDILLPEQRLVDYANQIEMPVLGLGTILQEQGMSVEQIQELFFNDGLGHLTVDGHQFLAELIATCFYDVETAVDISICE